MRRLLPGVSRWGGGSGRSRGFGIGPVPFTADRYDVKRGHYKALTEQDVSVFRSILPSAAVLEEDLEAYNIDWLRTVHGQSKLVLKPSSTAEVSAILSYCNKERLAVCPQGGNTGLVGGSVPVFDEIVLSTSRMDKILSVDAISGVLVCEAGCVLQRLSDHLASYGLRMPLDLGAKGSCQIGGNVSTNAGGLRLLRYGSLHGSLLGAEFVLADGTVVDTLTTLRKDNTGYDLKQLLVGAEGTLGVVTKLALSCPALPLSEAVALLACQSYEDVLHVFREARQGLGEIMSAFEFFDAESAIVLKKNLGLTAPISGPGGESFSPFYVLVETGGSNASHDEEKLQILLERLLELGKVTDGTIASEPSKIRHVWDLRERIAESLMHDGYVYKYDVSLPLTEMYRVVEATRRRLAGHSGVIRVNGYGHVGDSNLHLNVTSPSYSHEVLELLEPWLWEQVRQVRGSISAEHGIGFKKRDVLGYSKRPEAIALMQKLKQLFDPNAILNPYKTVPE